MARALVAAVLLLAVAGVAEGAPGSPDSLIYRIELKGGGAVWSDARPQQSGAALIFRLYPRGLLTSVRQSEVVRVVAVPRQSPASPAARMKPGDQLVLGATGGGSGGAAAGGARPASSGPRLPGENPDGTALFNPNRAYRPEWDSRQVPGLNMPYPAAAGDYREGLTLAYPPASAIQTAPGQPPMMPPSSGEPPKAPN